MRWLLVPVILLGISFPPTEALAQKAPEEAERLNTETGESGNAYLRAIRFRRINPQLAYYSPSGPAPELNTDQNPVARNDQDTSGSGWAIDERWILVVLTGGILVAIAVLFLRYGPNLAVSFKRGTKNLDRQRISQQGEAPVWTESLRSLDQILRMRDRRQALVQLARNALTATVAANGILMQRSWTARDALQRIPETQTHLAALRALVLSSERVQYGDREVSEDDFRTHVDNCRQLLGTGSS